MFIKIEKHTFNADHIIAYYCFSDSTKVITLEGKEFFFSGDYTQHLGEIVDVWTIQPTEQSDDK